MFYDSFFQTDLENLETSSFTKSCITITFLLHNHKIKLNDLLVPFWSIFVDFSATDASIFLIHFEIAAWPQNSSLSRSISRHSIVGFHADDVNDIMHNFILRSLLIIFAKLSRTWVTKTSSNIEPRDSTVIFARVHLRVIFPPLLPPFSLVLDSHSSIHHRCNEEEFTIMEIRARNLWRK